MDVDLDSDIPMSDTSTSVTIASSASSHTSDHAENGNEDEGKEGRRKTTISMMTPLDWKNEGKGFVDRKDWDKALHSYRSGLSALLKTSHVLDANRDITSTAVALSSPTSTSLELALRSNIALVLLKMDCFHLAKEECDHILSASPSNWKALYRRASSREGLYLSLNNHSKNDDQNNSNFEMTKKKDMLKAAIDDLQQALKFLDKERQQQQSSSENNSDNRIRNGNSSTMRQCQRSLDRLEKEYNRKWIQRQNNDEKVRVSSIDRNTNLDRTIPIQQELQADNIINSNGNDVIVFKDCHPSEVSSQITASKLQQKQDVLRLLLARQQILASTNGGDLSKQQQHYHKVLQGEAFFLLEWNWWVKWCRYVDFFYTRNDTTISSASASNTYSSSERTQRVLDYFPPGATVPLNNRKDRNINDDDNDLSDDDDDDDIIAKSPGPIDNTYLLVTPNNVFFNQWFHPIPANSDSDMVGNNATNSCTVISLKPNLIRGYHYEILPREVYNALRSWYGEISSPSLCRRVTKDNDIVMYPPLPSNGRYIYDNSTVQLPGRKSSRCNACRAPGANSRCRQCISVYCNKVCQESHWLFHRPYCKSRQMSESKIRSSLSHICLPPDSFGTIGLNNLGNTCFMNSVLQSLSHATPLTRYFLSNRFKSNLNTCNPLGTGGKLASAYEVFLKDVWMKSGIKSISPVALKRAIALFAPRFVGCHQHDAQEFLAYLLDGLHEDLNRILHTPYVELPDATDGQNMAIAAARAWDANKRRNDSLVLDTFYGQFQSTCVCPRCNRVSVSFDTFNHISLEIPSNNLAWSMVNISVMVHFSDGNSKPIRYGIILRRHSSVFDLKKAVSKLAQISVTKLVLTVVHGSSIYNLLNDNKHVPIIQPDTDLIVAYEVTPYTAKDTLHMIVSQSLLIASSDNNNNNERGLSTSNYSTMIDGNIENGDNFTQIPIGFPFITSMDVNNCTCHDLWQLIWNSVRRMVEDTEIGIEGVEIEGEEGDCVDKAHHCRLEETLTIHVVDSKGQPRHIFQTEKEDKQTSALPRKSRKLLSSILSGLSAENFLFLTLIWKSSNVCKKKEGIVINPKRFLDYDDHPSFIEAMRWQQTNRSSTKKEGVTLYQCFQSFSKPERLDVNNMWYCAKCQEHVQALKTMKLWKLPNILVVHLKRFEFKHALRRDKICTFIDFPLTDLNMDPHCAGRKTSEGENEFVDNNVPADYDLFAVVNHHGRMGFGHYTAFAMSWDESGVSKKWNVFDDSDVSPIDSIEIPSSAAYILFYRRRLFD